MLDAVSDAIRHVYVVLWKKDFYEPHTPIAIEICEDSYKNEIERVPHLKEEILTTHAKYYSKKVLGDSPVSLHNFYCIEIESSLEDLWREDVIKTTSDGVRYKTLLG